MGVRISSGDLDDLLRHAARSDDVEICGLLFGAEDRIERIAPCANVATDPARSFEIDPQALFSAIREERRGGPRLIGHYHSHPSGSAEPSARDAAAAEPGRLWLILGGGEARLYLAEPGRRFRPVALEIG